MTKTPIKIFAYFSLLIISIFLSCTRSNQNKNKYQNYQTEEADTIIGKSISFPKALKNIKNGSITQADSIIDILNNSECIVSIIDATCLKCIYFRLNLLDSIFRVNLPPNIERVFVINIENRAVPYFLREMYPAINAKGTLLLDTAYVFEKSNRILSPNENHRIFFIDSNGKIAQYGDPLIDQSILYKYVSLSTESH
ncbi:hypothetical protein [Tenuifilum thalassicum]|uniref:Redoxin domain-containing protein n=1 Tax=Tenuifilum thalassicum TaxID=2590900 RepID=A0A7D4C1E8_9BACT|nr:hypothetical protein [Tenuifilum thalassicum]QKG80684.1 hypothetical protein FHG85_10540 [Tenuifilum thalassicum]